MLSIVVPCYNEEESIPLFYKETQKVLNSLAGICGDYEFIFVDDGSADRTSEVIRELSFVNKCVHCVRFSRNFGKEAALYAGLEHATGDYIAVLDVDLQDPPELIPEMLNALLNDGFDCAACARSSRKNEPPIRSFFARLFYKLMGFLSDVEVKDGARDFRVMTKKYRDAVLSLREKNRFTKGIFPWVGFNVKYFEYQNIERKAGSTKWSFWKLFLYSIDGIIGFSTKPLFFSAVCGILGIFTSTLLIVAIIIRKLVLGNSVEGWASLVCIILFLAGLELLCMGIMGLYLSKIYSEVKDRPLYVVKELF